MIDYSAFPIPKPGKRKKPEVRRDGTMREPGVTQRQRILKELCEAQDWRCYLCGLLMTHLFASCTPVIEHVKPGKMGGCKDWSRGNLKAACWQCNYLKGSKRLNGKAGNVRS